MCPSSVCSPGVVALDTLSKACYIHINKNNRINNINMLRERLAPEISEFLRYLASHPEAENGLPALNELSRELGISLTSLREQLGAARALGLVEVRPRTGTRRRPYSFASAVSQSLRFALALNDGYFQKFAELRNHIEVAYWNEAVQTLTEDDKQELRELVRRAREKLARNPVQVPHEEHRALHLLIYSRLNNVFVNGILEAYWDAYEAVGLNMYHGSVDYLNEVWQYHAQMVESICHGNYEAGRQALIKHIDLLAQRQS